MLSPELSSTPIPNTFVPTFTIHTTESGSHVDARRIFITPPSTAKFTLIRLPMWSAVSV
ncbi:hypothetical protein BURPS305_7508 [Burkholderia pseudomallei 305]|nr:hypothetical protein BURPS305_7508 [Burkholderia pseudomallei 305]